MGRNKVTMKTLWYASGFAVNCDNFSLNSSGKWNRCPKLGSSLSIDSWDDYDLVLGQDVFETKREVINQLLRNLETIREKLLQELNAS